MMMWLGVESVSHSRRMFLNGAQRR